MLAVLVPFSTTAPLTVKAATAVVDLILGVAIGSLISGVAARSVRVPRAAPDTRSPIRSTTSGVAEHVVRLTAVQLRGPSRLR